MLHLLCVLTLWLSYLLNAIMVSLLRSLTPFDDKNNYFLEYVADHGQTLENKPVDISSPVLTKSDGYWKEVAKPWEQTTSNNGTLPSHDHHR